MLTCLTMRCWADTRLSQSLSGGTLLSGCISSRWAFPWSRLCRGSCGVPWASALSSFSQDKFSWLMASSPSTTEAKGDVACLEDMTLLWSNNNNKNNKSYLTRINTWKGMLLPWVFHGRLAVRIKWLCMEVTGSGTPEQINAEWTACSTWLSCVTALACQVCSRK